jgi:hypothetical protein
MSFRIQMKRPLELPAVQYAQNHTPTSPRFYATTPPTSPKNIRFSDSRGPPLPAVARDAHVRSDEGTGSSVALRDPVEPLPDQTVHQDRTTSRTPIRTRRRLRADSLSDTSRPSSSIKRPQLASPQLQLPIRQRSGRRSSASPPRSPSSSHDSSDTSDDERQSQQTPTAPLHKQPAPDDGETKSRWFPASGFSNHPTQANSCEGPVAGVLVMEIRGGRPWAFSGQTIPARSMESTETVSSRLTDGTVGQDWNANVHTRMGTWVLDGDDVTAYTPEPDLPPARRPRGERRSRAGPSQSRRR